MARKWRENGAKTPGIYHACLKGIIPTRMTYFPSRDAKTWTCAMIALYFINNDTLTLIIGV